MYEVRIDTARNVLRTRWIGVIRAADMKAAAEEVDRILPGSLKPGFSIVSDWSLLKFMELDCVPFLSRIMDRAFAAGVATVVRVLPNPEVDIGVNILSIIHYRGRVKTRTCMTVEEAEAALP